MKKIITTLIFTLLSIIVVSQNSLESSDISTTYDEYNYLTNIYGIDDSATMLKGYELEDFLELSEGQFKYNFKLFKKIDSGNVKAVFITITKIKKKEDKVRYLCMPINNDQLFSKFDSEVTNIGISMSLGLELLNKKLISRLIDEKFNIE
ncbi:hypothetical protein [Mangrovimonas sp. TPBH4]|uniref:hypothetical protein n=1 Tax=Mangrovimonas sp. TPBH4 TaxID=1645914 RepID=UPI0006B553CB|nr:hypothetical protein [Mangrovimonas sp. TPBH4]